LILWKIPDSTFSHAQLAQNFAVANLIAINTTVLNLSHRLLHESLLSMQKDFQLRGTVDDVPETRDQMLAFIGESCNATTPDYNLLVAIQEALANAVVHGCGNNPSETVHCHVECNDSAIAITVRNPGPGFDVSSLPDPTSRENLAEEHGRGIFLLRSLMDEVRFEEGGRLLQMCKLRRPA
jgi:anti-sigma regulatory factor (Ser/Thr protein kinase)